MDPWMIQPAEKARYHAQFKSLNPVDNHVTGEQAKGLFLKSGLHVAVLGKIWTLADRNADGKMDISEFSIACKLITMKLKGQEIPATLPPSLVLSSTSQTASSPTSSLPSSAMAQNFMKTMSPPSIGPTSNVNLLMNGSNLLNQAPIIPHSINAGPGVVPLAPTQPILPMTSGIPVGGAPVSMHGLPSGPMGSLPAAAVPNTLPPMPVTQPLVPVGIAPVSATQPLIPTGMTPPSGVQLMGVPPMSSSQPLSGIGVLPLSATTPPSLPGEPNRHVPSLPSQDSQSSLGGGMSPTDSWNIPHSTKLKNTQLFNTHDRVKSGFLSGPQARHILVQTGLQQAVLAKIWSLADVSSDGKLSCDEFVLAMHLCDMVKRGEQLPVKLPPDLIPPQYRRVRLSSQSSVPEVPSGADTPEDARAMPTGGGSDSRRDSLSNVTFEDKRKENFEKGQAELERRRKALQEIQHREEEERLRKEREEFEKRERIRLEIEEKRREEMERQQARLREIEMQKEEERRKKLEQQEAARKEMERQRQLEWEKQRRQELLQQRQKEQETVLQLKAQKQKLVIELTQTDDKLKELNERIGVARDGVTSVKSVIDGMRTTRDTKVSEMTNLKTLLKEHNAALLQLAHEKSRFQEKTKMMSSNWADDTVNSIANTVVNKTMALKQLRDKLELYEEEKRQKILDKESASSQLEEFKSQLCQLLLASKSLYNTYQQKRAEVYNMKYSTKASWDTPSSTITKAPLSAVNGTNRQSYRVLYQFDARNSDELSLVPGEIITIHHDAAAEPHWLVGETSDGRKGWFPESYVEPCDASEEEHQVPSALEGISEVPENGFDHSAAFGFSEDLASQVEQEEKVIETDWTADQSDQMSVQAGDVILVSKEEDGWSYGTCNQSSGWFPTSCIKTSGEYYVALYNYQSEEETDLNFNAGDVILVIKKDGDWWTGTFNSKTGIFPYNYVQSHTQESKPQEVVEEVPVSQANVMKGKKPEIATVIAPYQATGEGQLHLQRGQLILIKKKTNSGWWEGELQAKGKKRQIGWFPATYVKLMGNPKSHTESRDVADTVLDKDDPPIPESAAPELGAEPGDHNWGQQAAVTLDDTHGNVEALYPYTAQNSDELSFQKGDVIKILDDSDAAWWKGSLNGQEGMFPSNYVGPLKEEDGTSR